MAVQNFVNAWNDALGGFRQTVYFWDTFVGRSQGLGVQMTGLSNAGLTYYLRSPRLFDQTTEGANAVFPAVNQIANMTFAGTDGSIANIVIPAPRQSIFLPDGVTVDPLNLDVLAFTNIATNGALITSTGATVTQFLAGFRGGQGTNT